MKGSKSYLRFQDTLVIICLVSIATTVNSQSSCTKVEAYNVAATTSVPDAATRLPRIISALSKSNADYICLQEIWMEKDLQQIVDGVKSTFPHHFSALHASKDTITKPVNQLHAFFLTLRRWFRRVIKTETACNGAETLTLSTNILVCGLIHGCLQKSGWDLGRCITQNCDHVLRRESLRPTCISCIFLNALNSLPEAINQCSIPTGSSNRLNGPGLLVLSKHELGDITYHDFFPGKRAVLQRGYISAQLPNGLNSICTHLSSNVEAYLEYDLSFGGYEQQQAVEIGKLAGTGAGVIMGDLNTGPRAVGQSSPEQNLEGEFVENFQSMVSLGYRSPYANSDGRCTYCSDNDIVEDYPNQILDHVMVKSDVTTKNVERLYDGESPPLSDHYGVGMDVCLE